MAEPSGTGNGVFEQAIMLMDEQSDSGAAVWSDTQEYRCRALAILNTLLGECYPCSDNYAPDTPGQRPAPRPMAALEDAVPLDGSLAGTALPYGLAAELVKNDDPALGNYFLQRYQELLDRLGRKLPAAWTAMEDVYGVVGWSGHGRW